MLGANVNELKIATRKIKRGLIKRELEIAQLLSDENIDILFLTESDIKIEDEAYYKISDTIPISNA